MPRNIRHIVKRRHIRVVKRVKRWWMIGLVMYLSKNIYKAIGKKVGGGRGGTLNQHIWRERERWYKYTSVSLVLYSSDCTVKM